MTNLMTAHTQWASRPEDQRFTNLTDLAAAVDSRRNRSKVADLSLTDLEVKVTEDKAGLYINTHIRAAQPTNWAFGQLAQRAGAPAGYLRTLPAPMAADCLNFGLKNGGRDALKLLTLNEDGEYNTLQAVTSPTYGRIWDADCVSAVQRIVDRTDGRFFNPKAYDRKSGGVVGSGLYASDRDVFMFMIDGGSLVDGRGTRDQLNRGFIVWNSEVGSATFGLMTFLFRAVCGNHIIWGASDVKQILIRHTAGGPARFDGQATPALLDYANASVAPIEAAIKKAKDYLLPKDSDGLIQWAAGRGFTRAEIRDAVDIAEKEEGDCRNLWNFVQGLTASAREYAYMDARVNLEKRAGKLMDIVA